MSLARWGVSPGHSHTMTDAKNGIRGVLSIHGETCRVHPRRHRPSDRGHLRSYHEVTACLVIAIRIKEEEGRCCEEEGV